jgi:hypothetical protein
VPAIAAVASIAMILKPPAPARSGGAALVAAVLAIQLAAFFSVYVMTPHSVAWHVSTSWSRLVAQLWPSIVWWACLSRQPRTSV